MVGRNGKQQNDTLIQESAVAIRDKNINFRAPEQTHTRLGSLMKMFERDRSWIMRKAVDVFWTIIFAPHKLNEFFHEWQAFTGTNGHAGATQLKLVFHEQSNPPFFPKVSNYEENV